MPADAEPSAGLARPTPMRLLATAVLSPALLCLGLTACGDAVDTGGDTGGNTGGDTVWGECDAAAFADARAEAAGRLQGADGTVAEVKLTAAGDGPCAHGLVARTDSGTSGVDVSGLDLDPRTAALVSPGGGAPELLRVDGAAHPRGGFQPHLFVLEDDGLAEVTLAGEPVLPFVATDGGAKPSAATCSGDGEIELLEVRTSKPPGVVMAWDVYRSTYPVGSGELEPAQPELVRDHAADPILRREMPELFEPAALFQGCSSPWGR
jgi:hypothetical protein